MAQKKPAKKKAVAKKKTTTKKPVAKKKTTAKKPAAKKKVTMKMAVKQLAVEKTAAGCCMIPGTTPTVK